MSVVTELQEELQGLQTARFVTTMLRDISASRLQEIRKAFEKNAAFYEEIRDLDALVQTYALRRSLIDKDKDAATDKRNVFVALTSNKRFAGTLNQDITKRLIDRMESDPESECIVIGSMGQLYVQRSAYADRCEYVTFESDEPTSKEALSLIDRLSEYDQIYVFYPKFINSFHQEVALIDITHKPDLGTAKDVDVDYIFEPDIEELLSFFETQIRSILFNRVLLETKLAQTGARLTKMQRAREKAGELVEDQGYIIHKEKMSLQNMHLLETFAGFHKLKDV